MVRASGVLSDGAFRLYMHRYLSADRGSSNDAECLPVIRYPLARKGASHPAPLTCAGVIDYRVTTAC